MNIVILGTGNVAYQFGKAFAKSGHSILQVYSRKKANADALASALKSSATTDLGRINTEADLYVIAVADRAVGEIVAQLPPSLRGIVVHCSGATPMDILSSCESYGVIYPAQSIRKEQANFSLEHIPFGIEGNSPKITNVLLSFMLEHSKASFRCNSEQRLALHVAAVFVNNFANALFGIGHEILDQASLPFDLLKPIILETARKVMDNPPQVVQTGPAKRGDLETMKKHLDFISGKPDWVKIYQDLSREISSRKDS